MSSKRPKNAVYPNGLVPRKLILTLILGCSLLSAVVGSAQDVTSPSTFSAIGNGIIVTTLQDTATGDGACSLREAIFAANNDVAVDTCPAGSGDDTILLTGLSGTITLLDALPTITSDLTLQGPGASVLAVERPSGATQNFAILRMDQAVVTITDLTLRGGKSSTGGGIVMTGGNLSLMRTVLENNQATSSGGAIFNDGGLLTVNHSTVRNNTAGSSGGGIFSNGETQVTASAIINNSAASSGGGFYHGAGNATLRNVTISGNSAGSTGGGLYADSGTVLSSNLTVASNTAGTSGGGISFLGDEITLKYTLIANNGASDCYGNLIALSHNLIRNLSCNLTNGSVGTITGVDPLLGALGDNGGDTWTQSLNPGSPAIDVGDPAGCEPADQRGTVRPQGGVCDIGAFEVSNEPAPPPIVPVDTPIDGTVLRGLVTTRDGVPLPNVNVQVMNHGEYGSTLTHEDGSYSLTANQSGSLTVTFEKAGYLSAQRTINIRWQDYTQLEDVALIQLDAQGTTLDLSAPGSDMLVAQGSVVSDSDGVRQATLMVPQGTDAEMVMADGSTQPLDTLTIRATEYTVGESGEEAMPGALPPTSGYTYAVEYSADEALAMGAASVEFSQPIYHYVENFLDFPVGTPVPVGYYDRERAAWIPSDNGVVVQIISISGGLANVDTDGDGTADNNPALGFTTVERQHLAELYGAGATLWRVPIKHFTPWDCNWPVVPPGDATPPSGGTPISDQPHPDQPDCQSGSIIECESQTLGEMIPVVGTGYTLVYRSDRVPGRTAAYSIDIPLTGSAPPASLKRVDVEVRIAGRTITQQYDPTPNQRTSFIWDGKDAYGRPLSSGQEALIRIGYVYQAVYAQPGSFTQSFAAFGTAPITGSRSRNEITIWQESQVFLAIPRQEDTPVAGWELDVHHRYDPNSKTLIMGDGSRRSSDTLNYGIISTIAGTGSNGFSGDGGAATSARFSLPVGIAVAPDGSMVIADFNNNRVRRIDANGIVTTVAGTGIAGYNGDSIPATTAHLNGPNGVAIAPDGSVVVTEALGQRIRRIAVDGTISTIAGTGFAGNSGDGGLATAASLNNPNGPTFASDGTLYFADTGNHRVRAITTSGIMMNIAGSGMPGYSGDNGAAGAAQLNAPRDVAIGADGRVYIADGGNNRIRQVSTSGIITTTAGSGVAGFSGDGGSALLAQLSGPEGVAVAPDGSVYISDTANHRLRVVGIDGAIATLVGTGTSGYNGDNMPGGQARINQPNELEILSDGTILFTDASNNRIRRVAAGLPGVSASETLIPSEDGSLVYVFSASGVHLRTLNALTGAILLQFGYDASGRLITLTDANNNVTTIQRSASGQPTGILSPYNQLTTLAVDGSGFLNRVTNPANEHFDMNYTAGGLLTRFADPRGNATSFAYDALGRLTTHTDPANNVITAVRSTTPDGADVITVTRPLNRTTTYNISSDSGGENRIITSPSGLQVQTTRGTDASKLTVVPDGSTFSNVQGTDPRWGMLAPTTSSSTITTPGGHTLTATETRTANLSNPANPFSLTSLTETIKINNRNYTTVYNASTHTFSLASPAGRTGSTVIDTQGRPVSETTPGIAQVSYTYDSQGRLATITQSGRTTTFAYNAAGYISSITDPLSQVTSYLYDSAGRVTQETLPGARTIQYTYDANGNLASLTPPGRTAHTFTYDALNQVTAYTPPDVVLGTDATTYAYNADQQVTGVFLPDGRSISMGYDPAGRLNGMTIARGSFTYNYDAVTGNLTTITAPGGISHALTYDGSLLLSETLAGTVAGSVNRTYDNDFRVTSVSVDGANPITYGYDADSLLTTAGALSLTYNSQNGLLTGTSIGTSPNAITDALTYSTFAEPTSYNAVRGGMQLFNVNYTRDALGRITTLVETIGGTAATYEYAYDTSERLSSVKKDGLTVESYTYDLNGNRLTTTNSFGTNVTATYDAQDRLLTFGGATYTYNANGDLIAKVEGGQTTTYSYDELGNLLSVGLPGGTTVNYVVDGAGRRIQRTASGIVTRYLWQGDLQIAAELDSSNSVVSRFVYATGVNVPDYMIKGGNTYRIITDHLGSVRLVVDVATGAIAQQMNYDGWGNVLQDTNPGFQPFGYAGGLYDPDTKLVRFGARDYDAQVGRWTTKDPIGFDGGDTNLYVYGANNPINNNDAQGQFVNLVIGAGISVATGYLLSQLTGQCYTATDALIDAATGAAGVGLFNKFRMLSRVNNLRNLAQREGMVSRGLARNIETWVGQNGKRLDIKYFRSSGPRTSQVYRAQYRTANGVFRDPFSGAAGPKNSRAAHIPLEALDGEAATIGAGQGAANAATRSNGNCDCQ